MRKRIVAILLGVFCVMSLIGCGETGADLGEEVKVQVYEKETVLEDIDDVLDGLLILDGKEVRLPIALKDFHEIFKWNYHGDMMETIPSGDRKTLVTYAYSETDKVFLTIANLDEQDKAARDCYVVCVESDTDSMDKISFEAGAITLGKTTTLDAKNAYGSIGLSGENVVNYNKGCQIVSKDGWNRRFSFEYSDNGLYVAKLEVANDDFEKSNGVAIRRSKVELAANQILFDGTVFDVPMSVKDIEKLGWKTSNNNELLRGHGSIDCFLNNENGSSLYCTIINDGILPKRIKNCTLVTIIINTEKMDYNEAQLLKGIMVGGSTVEEVKNLMGEPSSVYEIADSTTIYYNGVGAFNTNFELAFHGPEQVLSFVTVSSKGIINLGDWENAFKNYQTESYE